MFPITLYPKRAGRAGVDKQTLNTTKTHSKQHHAPRDDQHAPQPNTKPNIRVHTHPGRHPTTRVKHTPKTQILQHAIKTQAPLSECWTEKEMRNQRKSQRKPAPCQHNPLNLLRAKYTNERACTKSTVGIVSRFTWVRPTAGFSTSANWTGGRFPGWGGAKKRPDPQPQKFESQAQSGPQDIGPYIPAKICRKFSVLFLFVWLTLRFFVVVFFGKGAG